MSEPPRRLRLWRWTAPLTLSVCLSAQVQVQPQWQAQDPCNGNGKVRNVVASERRKGFTGLVWGLVVGFFFFFPRAELGFARAPLF